MKTLTCILSILVCVAVAGTGFASADEGKGRIEGQIVDAKGKGIGGIVVYIGSISRATLTDADGRFSLGGIPAGSYVVELSLGDDTEAVPGVTVEDGETTTLERSVLWELGIVETMTVYSASRRAERIVDAPAAVTTVLEEDIERRAATGQLPKLLEFTPGAQVTQSGIYDFNFNTRGFNSSLTRRVATLVDGRDPSLPFLGAQEWAGISTPLDDIQGMEFVRGPSAALYGRNAASGVLNITTKQPKYHQGGSLRLSLGELATTNADFRWAGSLGNEWYLKATAGVRRSDDFTRSRNGAAEYTVPCSSAMGITTDCLPQESVPLADVDNEIEFGSLRVDKHFNSGLVLTLEGGEAGIEGPVFQTGIGRVQVVDAERPWARINLSTDRWNALAYYTARDAPEQLALQAGNNIALDTERIHFEGQGNWRFAKEKVRVVLGGSYTQEKIDTEDPETGQQTLVLEPRDDDFRAFYGQADWDINDYLTLVLAARWDDSSLFDPQFNPKAGLVIHAAPEHSFRVTYNEAFQVANYSEFFLRAQLGAVPGAIIQGAVCTPFAVDCMFPAAVPVLAAGNEELEVEEVETIEVGYKGLFKNRTWLTVDYYNSQNENFITDLLPQLSPSGERTNPAFDSYDGVPPAIAAGLDSFASAAVAPGAVVTNDVNGDPIIVAVSYRNFGEVDTQGVDAAVRHWFKDTLRADLTYSWFDFDVQSTGSGLDDQLLPNSPEHSVSAGIEYVASEFNAGISARWVDEFRWVVGPFQGDVESYLTVDVTANWYVTDAWTVGVNVANLFDDAHWEAFGGDIIERRAIAYAAYGWN